MKHIDRTRIIIIGVFIVLVAGAFLFDGGTENPTTQQAAQSSDRDVAPEFSLPTYEGNTVSLSDIDEPVTVVNIWSSWCPFCTKELPDFAKLQAQFPNQVKVVAINRGEDKATAKSFTDSAEISDQLTFLLDPDESYYRKMGGFSMPETLFLNTDKEIIRHQRGPLSFKQMKEITNDLLKDYSTATTSAGIHRSTLGCASGQCHIN